MDTLFLVLHVVGAVFIVGPMAILPMSAMRAVRAGNSAQVATLAKSTMIFSYLSLIVFVIGFGLVGMADPKFNLSVTTPWVLTSIVLYVIAVVLSLVVVVPAMKRAASATSGPATSAASATSAPAASGSGAAVATAGVPAKSGYAAISAGSGIVSLLLVAVTVLMVWKP
jgi:uncharacterized membrane protein